jgi:hypothetical protein
MRVQRATQATGQVGLQIGGGTSSTDWLMYIPTSSNTLTWFGNSTTLMSLDTSGSLGLGVTPSAFGTGWGKAFQVNRVSLAGDINAGLYLSANCYYNGTNNKYINSDYATQMASYNGTFLWNLAASGTAGNNITFTQAMTLDASGNLLVGTTSNIINNNARLAISGAEGLRAQATASGGACIAAYATSTGATYYYVGYDLTASAIKFQVLFNGNVQNTNNSYGAISDVKLKENIVDASPKLNDLMQVKVRNYNLKTEPTHKQIGVIAQELETIFPAMIEETPDRDSKNNNLGTTTKSVKYSVFVPMLIKAMQEQQALIESLTARLNALENK